MITAGQSLVDRAQRLPGSIAEYGKHYAGETEILSSGNIRNTYAVNATAVSAESTSMVVRDPNCVDKSRPVSSELPFGNSSENDSNDCVKRGLTTRQLLDSVIEDLDSNAGNCFEFSGDKARSRVSREEPPTDGASINDNDVYDIESQTNNL